MVTIPRNSAQIPDSLRVEGALSLEWLWSLGEAIQIAGDHRAMASALAGQIGVAIGAQAAAFLWNSVGAGVSGGPDTDNFTQICGAPEQALGDQLALWARQIGTGSHGVIREDDISLGRALWHEGDPPGGGEKSTLPAGSMTLRSVLAVPVVSRSGALLGRVCLGHSNPSAFAEPHESLASGLAHWAAIAIESASSREQDSRNLQVLTFFARTSDVLGRSLDMQTTLRALARLAVPTLGDWCIVDLIESGGLPRRIAVEHSDEEKRALAEKLASEYPANHASEHGLGAVLRTGKTSWLAEMPPEFLQKAARDSEHAAILTSLGLRGYISAPLLVSNRIAGVITCVAAESARVYREEDVRHVEELARRAAQAMHNAELYQKLELNEHRLELQADTLEKQKRALETAQAELRAANKDLTIRARDHERMSIAEREANRAKSDFLASMSHELRTPLNAISGYVELLELGIRGPLTVAQREDLSRIRRSQQALLSLINDILNFSKLEAGQVRFDLQPVVVNDVIAAVEPMIRPQAEAKNIAYQTDSDGVAVTALADPERLAQVILNLVSNAVKYTDSGGAIVVSTRKTPTDALVSVRDTGCGIPEQKLTDIFDPFVQVESLPSTRQRGVGLGLAISRDIARAMKGNVTAQSKVGLGSEFTVSLPRADLQAGLDRVAGT